VTRTASCRSGPSSWSGVFAGRDDGLADEGASIAVVGRPADEYAVVDLRFVSFADGGVDVRPGGLDVQVAAGVVLAGDVDRVTGLDRGRLDGTRGGVVVDPRSIHEGAVVAAGPVIVTGPE
jgi:hypothetical protein